MSLSSTMTTQLQTRVALFVFLCISLAWGQATQSSPSHTQPKLRFVAQLSVNGCAVFVHDTGAKNGPHLAVEPLMCVMQSLHRVFPRYDPVIQQTYVGIPVMLRDDAMLTEVQHQLQHLSPKSLKFATVSDISVSTDKSSVIQVLGFYWSPDESAGTMRVWCGKRDWCIFRIRTVLRKLSASQTLLGRVTTEAVIEVNGTSQRLSYSLMMQNHSLIDPNIRLIRYSNFSTCHQLRYVRSIQLNKCTARVHQRLDVKGHFVIEPLLCHNFTSLTNESTVNDYTRDMYYLKLDVVLQDDVILNAVRRELADLSPLSVSFMKLWQAEIAVAPDLSRRFEIGSLQVSGDWRSGEVRVYCKTFSDCEDLRSSVVKDPLDLWLHVKWNMTSIFSDIMCSFVSMKYSYQTSTAALPDTSLLCNQIWKLKCSYSDRIKFFVTRQNRQFVVIQQRLRGSFSFQRGWDEYEAGFGDETDFWIGLSKIHLLSTNGVTLRVEMKLMNGSELHQEYSGFKVGDASTNYRMTCGGIIKSRSSDNSPDAMTHHSGMQFSTMDRDNDGGASTSCSAASQLGGKGGWWFNNCITCNPNNVYGSEYMWQLNGIVWKPLREIRLMLQF